MKVEALKEKARRHEQREEWQKALDLYQEALRKQDEDEPPDITLYNRVGDLQIRVGQIDGAVGNYETAIDLYMDAELPNNAIAICKKVLRNLPGRSSFFRRMGQIRASQGFLTDARQNFLTFAEQMTTAGDMDAALDALIEFVSLAPDDLEIRLGLASQLESHDRTDEAMEQYADAYRRLILLDQEDEAEAVAEKVRELSPEAVLPDPQSVRAGASGGMEEDRPFTLGSSLAGMELDEPVEEPASPVSDLEITTSLGEMGGGEAEDVAPVEGSQATDEVLAEEEAWDVGTEAGVLDGEETGEGAEGGEEMVEAEPDEGEPEPLPTLSFEDEEDEEAVPTFGLEDGEEVLEELPPEVEEVEEEEEEDELPTFDFEEGEEAEALPGYAVPEEEEELAEEDLESLPTFGFEESAPAFDEDLSPPASSDALEEAVEESASEVFRTPEPATHQEAAEQGDPKLALEMVRSEIDANPDEVELHQRRVEYAFRTGDQPVLVQAYLELARCLARTGVPGKARSIYQQVLSLDPEQGEAREELDALDGVSSPRPPAQVASSEEYVDLGSMILGEEAEKTTRWQVAADAPSGDEQADFAKMLNQFKEKVSEHVDAGDVAAHHDLGTAYMEMGLFEEAISEFQMALRASPNHLPTHEVMGRCWMESDQPDMAIRALQRALEVRFEVEDELIGIYYLMGRAQEAMGNSEQAVEYYEKVFSLDINFEDVTERLRALR